MNGKLYRAFNRLAKWRIIFAGWQLGTRSDQDPETQAVRDHRENTLLTRVELSALTNVLIEKGVLTIGEYEAQLEIEIEAMHDMLERKFPGMKATDDGMRMTMPEAGATMKGWRP